jgi:hypothetical protein
MDEDYARRVESEDREKARRERVRQQQEERSKLSKSAVVDQESGYLLGYNIKDERGNLIRFEKVRKVPIAES